MKNKQIVFHSNQTDIRRIGLYQLSHTKANFQDLPYCFLQNVKWNREREIDRKRDRETERERKRVRERERE